MPYDDDLVARRALQPRQPLGQVLGIVVAEPDRLGVAHLAGVVDRGMAVGVDQKLVALLGQGRDHAEIGHETRGIEDRRALVVEFGDLGLQRPMLRIGAVGDPRAGGAGAEIAHRRDGGVDAVLIEGQPQIVVGTEQHHRLAVENRPRRRGDTVEFERCRVAPQGLQCTVGGPDRGCSLLDTHEI